MAYAFDFVKYQAAGNDFILIDDRRLSFPLEAVDFVARLCDRRFGIGADGLMLIRHHVAAHFELIYCNADGRIGSLCGNGSRAAAHFARSLGLCGPSGTLWAADGLHTFSFLKENEKEATLCVSMRVAGEVELIDPHNCFLDTGSPHHVVWVDEPLDKLDLAALAPPIRFARRYEPGGTNVNFVQPIGPKALAIRTWERGVEAETLSCGTGVTAAAVAWRTLRQPQADEISIRTQGGQLAVHFRAEQAIELVGPVAAVFEGRWGKTAKPDTRLSD